MSKKLQKMLIVGAVVAVMWLHALAAYAAEFTVDAESANIRGEASTASDAVASAVRGTKLEVVGSTSDANGYTWYRVVVDADTHGYIRADTGTLTGTIAAGGAASGGQTATSDATPIPHQGATINQRSVNVRSGASTSHGALAALPNGTAVVLTAEAIDSSGRTWYQISATLDGEEINGFVRSDMLTLGELLEPDGGEIPDDTGGEEQPNEPDDDGTGADDDGAEFQYQIRYIQNDSGGYDYFIYDQQQGIQWKIDEFRELANVATENEARYQEREARYRTIIIVLAVVIVILVLVVTILLFKIRDLNDDIDDGLHIRRPQQPRGGPRPPGGEQGRRPGGSSPPRPPGQRSEGRPKVGPDGRPRTGERPGGGSRPANGGRPQPGGPAPRPVKPETRDAANGEKEGREPVERKQPPVERKRPEADDAKAAAPRKPQNFLTDDDEFEFEFLNIDE